jgi:hypothetical protein
MQMSEAAIDRLFYKSASTRPASIDEDSTRPASIDEDNEHEYAIDNEHESELGVSKQAFLELIAKQLRSVISDGDHVYQSISDMMADRSKTMDYARFLTHSSLQVRLSCCTPPRCTLLVAPNTTPNRGFRVAPLLLIFLIHPLLAALPTLRY